MYIYTYMNYMIALQVYRNSSMPFNFQVLFTMFGSYSGKHPTLTNTTKMSPNWYAPIEFIFQHSIMTIYE